MKTATGVAVVATQVAQTDRRALSEAWYSALHLAHGAAVPRAAAASRVAGAAVLHRPARVRVPLPPAVHGAAPFVRPHGPRDTATRAIGTVERRRPACEMERRIERAVTTLATRWNGHAAQTIELAGGRVRLLVRVDRGATRIIAVCSAPLREPVERALAHARFALAGGGAAVVTL